jgi:hypothetical protein
MFSKVNFVKALKRFVKTFIAAGSEAATSYKNWDRKFDASLHSVVGLVPAQDLIHSEGAQGHRHPPPTRHQHHVLQYIPHVTGPVNGC